MSQFFSSIFSSCTDLSLICPGCEDHGEVEGLVDKKSLYDDQGFYDMSDRVLYTMEDEARRKQNKTRSDAFEGGGFVSKESLEELKSTYGEHFPLVSKGDDGARQSDSQRQTEEIDRYLQSILNGTKNTRKPFHDEHHKTEKEFLDRTRPTLDSKKATPHPGDVDVPDSEFQPTGQTQLGAPTQTVSL